MIYYINFLIESFKSDSIFWFCSLAGTGMFLTQFIINVFIGSDQDSFDVEGNMDASDNSADMKKFRWFSIQTVTGFLMMFGWTAITCKNQFKLDTIATTGIALTVGILTSFIISSILKYTKKLHSSGSVFLLENSVGKEAYVYQTIPKNGIGRITISLDNMTHEIDAVSADFEELSSFTRVKIIKKIDDNTVVVAQL